jgi:hypothetical protein
VTVGEPETEAYLGAEPMVRIQSPPGERCYGAGDEELAPSSLRIN